MVPSVVKLSCQPDLLARDTAVFDSLTNFFLISVCQGSVNVPVALLKRDLDGVTDFVGLDASVEDQRNLGSGVLTFDCQVPRPIAGILAPVLRVKVILQD